MKEFKGTPGPWRRPKGSMTLFIDAPIGGGVLQEVAACCPTDNPDHRSHNANLIWAAPDLLNELQAMEMIVRELCTVYGHPLPHANLKRSGDAIAKALGEGHE